MELDGERNYFSSFIARNFRGDHQIHIEISLRQCQIISPSLPVRARKCLFQGITENRHFFNYILLRLWLFFVIAKAARSNIAL